MSSFSLLDIGNTSIKARKSFADYDKTVRIGYQDDWIDEVDKLVNNSKNARIVYCSSNRKAFEKLSENSIIDETSINAIDLISKDNDQFQIATEDIMLDFKGVEGIGQDRILGLYGAVKHGLKLFAYPSVIAVFNFGTATTLTVAKRDTIAGYKCLGGAILPGISIIKEQIKKILPFASISDLWYQEKEVPFGLNTNDAIAYGSFIAPLKAMFHDLRKEGDSVAAYLTGGNAEMMLPFFRENFSAMSYQKDLIMDTMGYLTSSQLRELISEW